MKMNRDFKGIWLPKEIWLNKDLTVMEKLFLVEIDSLDNENGCFASNAHFSNFFDLSKARCTQIIKSLESKKMISILIERDGKIISKRVIRILNTLVNKLNTPSKNIKHPYLENVQESNTLNNNNTKEGDTHALDFLKLNFPSRFESFLIQNKKQIKNFEKFSLDFNDTCDQEKLEYDVRVLFARLGKYARNWIENQNRFAPKEDENFTPTYLRKIL